MNNTFYHHSEQNSYKALRWIGFLILCLTNKPFRTTCIMSLITISFTIQSILCMCLDPSPKGRPRGKRQMKRWLQHDHIINIEDHRHLIFVLFGSVILISSRISLLHQTLSLSYSSFFANLTLLLSDCRPWDPIGEYLAILSHLTKSEEHIPHCFFHSQTCGWTYQQPPKDPFIQPL